MMIPSFLLALQAAPSISSSDLTAGGIVGAVLVAFKLWDRHSSKKATSSNGTQHNGELRAIRDTMTLRFDTLDGRVEDLKKDLGRELGEVKDRVGGLEKRERDRLERAVGAPDRRSAS